MSAFFVKNSLNVIVVYKSSENFTSYPIILSFGVGVEKFITWKNVPDNVVSVIGLNGQVVSWRKNVLVSGEMYFSPSSPSLNKINEIINISNTNGIPDKGTLSIYYPSSLMRQTFYDFIFLQMLTRMDIYKSLSDVAINFTCRNPITQSIGGGIIPSLTGIINDFLGI